MPLAMLQLPARIGFARPSVRTATVTRAMANVSTETSAKKEEEVMSVKVKEGHEKDGLTPEQVTTLLDLICDETDFAQVDLEIGAFELHVTRRTEAAAAAPAPAPVEYAAPVPAPAAPVASTAISEDETDEEDASHVLVLAPTVGVMRRGKYVKGKQVGKGNAAEEGDTVKKGQVLGYVEKLGTFEPVLSPQAGEVSAFLVDEGEPVSYNDPVVELSPFFGGHIIGDSKYA